MKETTDTIQDKIIEEFKQLTDWFDIYNHLISLGKKEKPRDKTLQTDEYVISGCQSQVWLKANKKEGKLFYTACSDSLIINGIISLLLRVVNNQDPKNIKDTDFYFIESIGLHSNLSPSRANGLLAIIKTIKQYADQNSE